MFQPPELMSEVSLTVDNRRILYLRVIVSDLCALNPEIVQIGARLGKKSYFDWIKPSRVFKAKDSIAGRNGLKYHDGKLFLDGNEQPTVPLKTALLNLLKFIEPQKQVLLVTYFRKQEVYTFFEAIRIHRMVDMFCHVIGGVVDAPPFVKMQFPTFNKHAIVKTPYPGQYFDTMYYLKFFDQLVTSLKLTSELFQKSESCKQVFQRAQHHFTRGFGDLGYFRNILSERQIRKLKIIGLSYSTLKDVYQRETKEKFFAFINKQMLEEVSETFQEPALSKIYNYFHEGNLFREKFISQQGARSSDDNSLTKQHEDINAGIDRFVENPVSGPPFPDRQNLVDQRPIHRNHDYKHYSITAQQEKLAEEMYPVIGHYAARDDNDHPFRSRPGDFIAGIGPFSDGPVYQLPQWQNPVHQRSINQDHRDKCDSFNAHQEEIPRKIRRHNNDYPHRRQPQDLNAEFGPFVEVPVSVHQPSVRQNLVDSRPMNQHHRDQCDSFTAQQEEILEDINQLIGENGAGHNGDHPLESQSETFNAGIGSFPEAPIYQLPQWQNPVHQRSINQDHPDQYNSFTAHQEEILRKIHRSNNDYPLRRQPQDFNTEFYPFVENPLPVGQSSDLQYSIDQRSINQDHRDKDDSNTAQQKEIPEDIFQFVEEFRAQHDNDHPFESQSGDLNAEIRPFAENPVQADLFRYWQHSTDQLPANRDQRGRDWNRDWMQEFNEFSGGNHSFFFP